jgi:hypothetical protein
MRHVPASAAIVIMLLRTLKMYSMAQVVSDLAEQGSPAFDAAVPILSQLLKAETAECEVRSVAYDSASELRGSGASTRPVAAPNASAPLSRFAPRSLAKSRATLLRSWRVIG